MSKTSNIILAALAGAAAGVAIGLLVAPEKGSDSRKKIKGAAKKLADTLFKDINISGTVTDNLRYIIN